MKPQISLFDEKFPIDLITRWVGQEWAGFLQQDFNSGTTVKLFEKIKADKQQNIVVPEVLDVFELYRSIPPNKVNLVILSQSPYPSRQAEGIAFSAKYGRPLSLQRLQRSLGTKRIDLRYLVDQGVWLQNTILTANTKDSLAHQHWGWEPFVQKTLQVISDHNRYMCWLCLGSEAYKFVKKVAKSSHKVFKVSHPVSKKSSDSWTCKTELDAVNHYLRKYGKEEITFSTPD